MYIDELSKEALIIYGVPSDIFASFDPVPIQRNLAEALRALSDSNRLTILGLLAQEPMYTTDLVSALGLSQPTVHYHLTQLRAAGLIRQEREKRGMRYSIRYHSAAQILRSLEALILEGSRRPGEGGKPEERTSECS
ncbi:MAG: ArsR/SmtB family transcription factor [Egibacteraceae bacterium]